MRESIFEMHGVKSSSHLIMQLLCMSCSSKHNIDSQEEIFTMQREQFFTSRLATKCVNVWSQHLSNTMICLENDQYAFNPSKDPFLYARVVISLWFKLVFFSNDLIEVDHLPQRSPILAYSTSQPNQ